MIETFNSCKKAYQIAFEKFSNGPTQATPSVICKKFMLRTLSEINRGRLSTVNQVQKYMGQHWPVEKLEEQVTQKDKTTRAFLFAYKSLIRYVGRPYCPADSYVVSVALKVRARIAHVRVYVEDTMDLVLWYPDEKRLEIVDFQLHPLKPVDPSWPSPALLVKYFLAEKLKTRWPFEKLTITQYRIGVQDYQPLSINLEESLFRVHWDELVKTIDEMKERSAHPLTCAMDEKGSCAHCQALTAPVNVSEEPDLFRLSA
jgi:hypothetical protein